MFVERVADDDVGIAAFGIFQTHHRKRQRAGNRAVAVVDEDGAEFFVALQEADGLQNAVRIVFRLIQIIAAAVGDDDERLARQERMQQFVAGVGVLRRFAFGLRSVSCPDAAACRRRGCRTSPDRSCSRRRRRRGCRPWPVRRRGGCRRRRNSRVLCPLLPFSHFPLCAAGRCRAVRRRCCGRGRRR